MTGYSIYHEESTYCNLEEELKKLKMDHPEFYKSAFEHDPSDGLFNVKELEEKYTEGILETRSHGNHMGSVRKYHYTQLYGSTQYELCKTVCSL